MESMEITVLGTKETKKLLSRIKKKLTKNKFMFNQNN